MTELKKQPCLQMIVWNATAQVAYLEYKRNTEGSIDGMRFEINSGDALPKKTAEQSEQN